MRTGRFSNITGDLPLPLVTFQSMTVRLYILELKNIEKSSWYCGSIILTG